MLRRLVALVALAVLAGVGASQTFTASRARAAAAPQLSLIPEPQAGVRPFTALIAGARHSIELTMYELSDPTVERALAAAAARGVDVRVALNGGYYSDRSSDNDAAYAYLFSHHVHVRYTPTYFALTHQKATPRSSVLRTCRPDRCRTTESWGSPSPIR
jgi:cardiolipin synthase A/B